MKILFEPNLKVQIRQQIEGLAVSVILDDKEILSCVAGDRADAEETVRNTLKKYLDAVSLETLCTDLNLDGLKKQNRGVGLSTTVRAFAV